MICAPVTLLRQTLFSPLNSFPGRFSQSFRFDYLCQVGATAILLVSRFEKERTVSTPPVDRLTDRKRTSPRLFLVWRVRKHSLSRSEGLERL